ncbi:MAG: CopG family transcriptional regulator [Clostridia bacterium]|nr:CopG family transcriptional regulator [Clostridia bacterium]
MPEKRKTTTSTAVKMRYNNKVYSTISVRLHKDLVADFKNKCETEGVSQAEIVRKAVEAFLNQ